MAASRPTTSGHPDRAEQRGRPGLACHDAGFSALGSPSAGRAATATAHTTSQARRPAASPSTSTSLARRSPHV
ncbi:hypothetical protein [Actinoallomurus iriomotensis]|uniref:hypothetical protein n=1 Tax=Actinoallomurus iriomotensis TaxID=478107 RepID=UPI002556579F|nr:hypothetical protein [Actinoallomurus iriomotensis]